MKETICPFRKGILGGIYRGCVSHSNKCNLWQRRWRFLFQAGHQEASSSAQPEFSSSEAKQVRDSGEWIVYDTEMVTFWDNVTKVQYTEVRGYVYATLNEGSDALKSTSKPIFSQIVSHPGANLNRVRLDVANTDRTPTGGATASLKKTHVMKCNMGFDDPTTAHLYSRCDRSKGLVCEFCNTEFGYMEDCVNPVGSRCRLCAACAPGFKRAGERAANAAQR